LPWQQGFDFVDWMACGNFREDDGRSADDMLDTVGKVVSPGISWSGLACIVLADLSRFCR
jgi:hypothetical protein